MDAVWMYHRFVSRRRPAMVVSAPADHDDQRDPEIVVAIVVSIAT